MNMKPVQEKIRRQKIAFISDQQYPVGKADSEQTMNTVSALASAGLNIQLVIPRKWRNIPKSNRKLKQDLLDFYHINDGFNLSELIQLPLTPLRFEKYSHGLIAPIYSAIKKYDIIVTRNPLSALFSLVLGKKVIFETYRVYNNSHAKTARALSKLTYWRNFLGIITHSIPASEDLVRLGAAKEKIVMLHNGFNPQHLLPNLSKSAARRILEWNKEEKIVCYSGRIDAEKGIESILDLAKKTPEITYVFIGQSDKNSKDWLETRASEKGVKNLRRYPWMQTKQLSKYLFASDVLIIPPTAEPMMKYGKTVLPIKVFIYMAIGRPIFAPRLADSQSVLHDKNAALVEPDNLQEAVKTLRRIFEEKHWANSIAERARSESKNYTWECRANKFLEFLSSMK